MSDSQTPEERLVKLERQVLWLKRAGCIAVIIAVAVFMGQTREHVVEATAFVLAGKDGRARGVWTVHADGAARLSLYDANEKVRGMWGVNADGSTSLSLHDKNETKRGVWAVLPDGVMALSLYDKDGKPRGAWCVFADGSTRLSLLDRDETVRASLGHTESEIKEAGATETAAESSLVFYDKERKVLFQAP